MIIVSKPESMLRTRIVIVRDELDKALSVLQELGAIHVEESTLPGEKEKKLIKAELTQLKETQKLIEDLTQHLPPGTITELRAEFSPLRIPVIIQELSVELKRMKIKVDNLASNAESYEKEIESLKSKISLYTELMEKIGDITPDTLSYEGKVIEISSWIAPSTEAYLKTQESIAPYATKIVEVKLSDNRIFFTLMYLSTVKDRVRNMVTKHGCIKVIFESKNVPFSQTIEELLKKVKELEHMIGRYRDELNNIIERSKDKIALLKVLVENEVQRLEAIQKAITSKFAAIVEGWIPISEKSKVEEELVRSLKSAYIEFEEPGSVEEPPTKLRNIKPFKPFEVLTKLYSLPKYKEWDPTPLIAYSFSLFFGLMLADVGYGIALFFASIYILPKLVEDPTSEGFQKLRKLLMGTGICAVFFGAISASFFGDLFAFLLPSPLINLAEPASFISLSLLIGLFHVNIAHALACARGFVEKNLGTAISELGLLIAQVGGIPLILEKFLNVTIWFIPAMIKPHLLHIAFIGLAMVVFGRLKAMGGLGGLMWLFDLTGLLGDVMSYSRLAGVGMATYYLAYSFNTMIGMVRNSIAASLPGIVGTIASGFMGAILLSLVHTLNLALGVLGAFIHSMRLCYVEFMPKFFIGGGREFMPLRVVIRSRIVLR